VGFLPSLFDSDPVVSAALGNGPTFNATQVVDWDALGGPAFHGVSQAATPPAARIGRKAGHRHHAHHHARQWSMALDSPLLPLSPDPRCQCSAVVVAPL
jgi:hypothetical protein